MNVSSNDFADQPAGTQNKGKVKDMEEKRPISKEQIKTIWGIWKGRFKLDEADFYYYLENSWGCERMHDLSEEEADYLIADLWVKHQYTQGGASKKQIGMIRAFQKKWNWSQKALREFIRKIAGVEDIRFLNGRGAWKVCAALKDMDRKNKERHDGAEKSM